jgi:hypothetical protein
MDDADDFTAWEVISLEEDRIREERIEREIAALMEQQS